MPGIAEGGGGDAWIAGVAPAVGIVMLGIGWVSAGVAIPAANALVARRRRNRVKLVSLARGSARS